MLRSRFLWKLYAGYVALILLSGSHIGIHVGPSIVRAMVPKLAFDKDGLVTEHLPLVEFGKEGVLSHGYRLRYSDHLLAYDPSLQGGLLELLAELGRDSQIHVRVAVNPHIVLSAEYGAPTFTRMYIRGPKAPSSRRLCDPYFPNDPTGEVTEHRRLSVDPALALILPLEAVQVMWSKKGLQKKVEIEELVPVDSSQYTGTDKITNRYVHSIWGTDLHAFTHADGALRSYSKGSYPLRLRSDLRKYPVKAGAYKKLFRVDGLLDLTRWAELACRFFSGNELVLEYIEQAM